MPLFGVGSVDVRLCSLCVPAFCATPAFLSMTGCRKGLFGPVLTPFWVWDGQRDPAYPYTAKMQVREKCSQVGEEMALFSVPPPIWFLVATRAFTGAMHLLCHTTVSIQVSFVFLAWSVLKYLSGVGKWVGWEVRILLSPLFRKKLCWKEECLVVYFMLGEMGRDCSAALACSLLESSSELCWQACLFWCKQGSAPGSSGSELWCLNRLLGYAERDWMPLKCNEQNFTCLLLCTCYECGGKAEMEEDTSLSGVACEALSVQQFQALLVWETKGILWLSWCFSLLASYGGGR